MEKEFPVGWADAKIGDLYSFLGGGTPSKTVQKYWNGSIPWASVKDISRVDLLKETVDTITQEGLNNSSANLAEKGDVIIGTRMTIGKPVIAGIQTAINQDLKIVKGYLPNKFTFYWFKALIDKMEALSSGTTVKGIRIESLNELRFPLPPLPEQQRIVAKLDTLFGHLDALKTRLERIPQLLKEFRQKVLTQAVTGKLTEEWSEGRELEECDLDYFCESSFYGPRFSTEEYSASGYPTVRTTDMTDNGFISIGFNTPRVSIQNKKKIELYKINSGDLLITRTGSIGKMARYIGEEIAIPSAYLIRFRFNEKALTDFIYYCLTSPDGQNQMGLSSTAITQPNLNAQKIRALKIPNLPIEEQREIVHRIETLFAKADQIEAGYLKLKAKVDQLPQALLAKAFRGELVEQFPIDLPAGSDGEFFAYVLYCSDGSLYKGFTNNLKRRYEEHKTGKGAEHTSKYKPLYVYHYEVFKSEAEAVKREKFLKSGHGREWLKQMEKENRLRQAGGDARELLEQIKQAKEGLEKGGKGRKIKVEDQVRMVAEAGARNGKK